jgi:hypothetical protein
MGAARALCAAFLRKSLRAIDKFAILFPFGSAKEPWRKLNETGADIS